MSFNALTPALVSAFEQIVSPAHVLTAATRRGPAVRSLRPRPHRRLPLRARRGAAPGHRGGG
ncbi:MAG: hypothetical protein WKG07_03395 [Hymenobacter sp.]